MLAGAGADLFLQYRQSMAGISISLLLLVPGPVLALALAGLRAKI